MQGSLKSGSIAGIDIRLHYTWLFAFFLIALSLALGYLPGSNTKFGVATPWILGIVTAMLLFGSVLLHELAHSFVAGWAPTLRSAGTTVLVHEDEFNHVANIASAENFLNRQDWELHARKEAHTFCMETRKS